MRDLPAGGHNIPNFKLQFAELNDLAAWIEMIQTVRDNFPGLETAEQLEDYKKTVIKNIKRKTALCTKSDNGNIVGVLIFSHHSKCLSCMAVHPNYRKIGIGYAMVKKMIELFPKDMDISVTTFREGDLKGVAPRALYKKIGFLEDELVEEFNYPHQKFIFRNRY
ncbi:ribosomal protein S18 acetylase RimI-like enzyme [Methanococcus maripaludis]|uniref:Ribosomal protein S18 acetylase RimI-like enzyme n=1 Tax=Methanococcus maripaludis TaxID=39152 RepID=A0A7J9P0Q9_METMI|nr:GNAT family N-acetyltransferase [Methanococcus maripaludis]MBA2853540.1 ribosomal protein S18 acetylase RimI-like enzyme [Methanococcus maripaludis]